MTEELSKELLAYYKGDDFAGGVWQGKYAVHNKGKILIEKTPDDMHRRLAKELGRIEAKYIDSEKDLIKGSEISDFGKKYIAEVSKFSKEDIAYLIYMYLKDFKSIIPQGSIMTMLGNPYKIGSLSNCFVVPPPSDSYGGIFKTDQHLAQLMKRRGGVGTHLSTLRPVDSSVSNAAGSSTGATSFMHRFSNTTREVAQNGRRGALMLLLHCLHPEIFDFVKIKANRTQVTGANISTMLSDKFMQAAENNQDFFCQFPIDFDLSPYKDYQFLKDMPYNKIEEHMFESNLVKIMKIHAKELYDLIIEMAWDNAEPGVAFIDTIQNYSPEGVYEMYRAIACNPCGEQWMQAYDACRLLAINLFSIVKNPYRKDATIDLDKLYEISYIQQRLADAIVDLEIEYVDRIIKKIESDPEDDSTKAIELELWKNIKQTAENSRRTGCGFTTLGDMLAALGLKYDSDEAIWVIEAVLKKKMEAELDATIDMAITRGTFKGWNGDMEFDTETNQGDKFISGGMNDFYDTVFVEFPAQARRMYKYGRRNCSWSTVAPTGSVSIILKLIKYANGTSGIEPLFSAFHFRKKKVNPSDKGVRIDFVDQNNDSWTVFPIVMGGFKEWLDVEYGEDAWQIMNEAEMTEAFSYSPYFGSTANDISWEKRIHIQSIAQKYTTNAISSTINLPKDVSKEVVSNIYMQAWKKGLKGVTIYRDGCRTGVLTHEKTENEFGYKDAIKRGKELDADLHVVTVKGNKYGVVVGLLQDKPYEVFAFNLPENVKTSCKGKLIKVKKGHYNFVCEETVIKNLQEIAVHKDEQVLTRLVSGMLRHGAKPQFVMEQIDKCELEIVSFGKALSRVLKKYVKDEDMINRNTCKDCQSANVKMQEGCLTCMDCGSSKCG